MKKTLACLICAALTMVYAVPRMEEAAKGMQSDLRRNLSCTLATYAALDDDATEADFERAAELCPEDLDPWRGQQTRQ
jgi:hypothetical protein